MENLSAQIYKIAEKAKQASREIAKASPEQKNKALTALAHILLEKKAEILKINSLDITEAQKNNLSLPKIDRLTLTEKIIQGMADACLFIADLPDPIGTMDKQWQRPNGLLVGKMRIPLGVIAMIYESRPNVTIDAAILCLKAGNAVILRGGSEAYNSNVFLAKCIQEALKQSGLDKEIVQYIENTEHESIYELCKLSRFIDVMIPRGGEKMVQSIASHATMPVLKHDKGVPHLFVDESADFAKTIEIIFNAKTQRTGVCNALEGVLVHSAIAEKFIPLLEEKLAEKNVEIFACEKSLPLFKKLAKPIKEEHKGREFGALQMVCLLVNSLDEALDYIHQYGSHHTEVICTNNYEHAQRFLREADAAMVAVNASSRFNDGGELGLGAEIGISTTKMHAYGPMGVEELTTTKSAVYGNGQIRQ